MSNNMASKFWSGILQKKSHHLFEGLLGLEIIYSTGLVQNAVQF